MSRSPSERWPLSVGRALGRALGRSVRRARGSVPRHTVYLQAHGLHAWRHASGTHADTIATAYASFDSWCVANPGADATAYVSGHLLHSLVVDPAMALDDDAAVRSYARQQFAHYHGAEARRWTLAAWCDDFGAGACALHALDLGALRVTAAKHDVQLRSVAPAWSAGLRSLAAFKPSFAAPGLHALALVEGTLLTWLAVDSGRIIAMQQRFLDAPRGAALADVLARLVDESTPSLVEPPLVVGWDLDDSENAALLPCQRIGPLASGGATTRWMLDLIGAVA